MSFQRSAALEAQPTTYTRQDDPQYSDDPDFNRFTTDLSDKLFSLTSNISQLNRHVELVGTKRETERVRERLQGIIEETNTAFKDIGEGLKKLSTWPDLGPSQIYTRNKLNTEFKASLPEFQLVQTRILEKQKASASAARTALEESDHTSSGPDGQQQQLLQQQQDLAPQSEVDFQESLIIERESEIRQIEQSVGELNELFRDVGVMVSQQGQQLDSIYVNVHNTRDDTQGADTELRQASRYQKSARNKACCLLFILSVVIVVVIVAVVSG